MIVLVSRIGMLLITTFVELRVIVRRSRMQAGHPNAISGRPMLIHTFHAVLCRVLEKSLLERHCRGIIRARQGMCESKKAALSKSSGEDVI
jgi:hypothetical protein